MLRSVSEAEALDRCEDVVGGLGPSEGCRIGIVLVEEGHDVIAQGSDAAINAAPDLALGMRAKKRSTWFSHEALLGVRWTCQRDLLSSQLRISGVLWVA